MFSLIVAIEKQTGGIGYKNDLIVRLKKDMAHFRKTTTNTQEIKKENVVIMGRKTWESIPEKYKPLRNRTNVILSRTMKKEDIQNYGNTILFNSIHSLLEYRKIPETNLLFEKWFVIGGSQIYKEFIERNLVDEMILTEWTIEEWFPMGGSKIDKELIKKISMDTYFPMKLKHIKQNYEVVSESDILLEDSGIYGLVSYVFKTYKRKSNYKQLLIKEKMNNGETQYLKILNKILQQGEERQSRNAKTLSIFGERLEFDIEHKFPLLTTKKMFWKGIYGELLWFLKANTNSKDLEKAGVRIWQGNSTREYLDSIGLNDYAEGECGPIYGFQWRHFNAKYEGCDADYTGKGVDQLGEIIRLIREQPNSRRMFMSGWNPTQMKEMALPPCHVSYQFYVQDGYLSCQMYQRSGDMFLGVPFNIGSTALLTYMLAHHTGLKPKKIVIVIGDAHIYEQHIDAVNTQLIREPMEFPTLKINCEQKENIEDYTSDDLLLENYKSLGRISAPMIP